MGYTESMVPLVLWTTLCLYLCSKLFTHWKSRQAVLKNGCQPPPRYPHRYPLGLDLLLDQLRANKRGNTAAKQRERFLAYGKTFETNLWGTRCIDTMDVKNIQAVLSQSFDAFGVEPIRLGIGEPFIGRGVFSTDGAYWKHSRDLIKPMFARAQISDFAALDVHLDHLLNWIPRDGSTVDLQALLKLMVCLSQFSFVLWR